MGDAMSDISVERGHLFFFFAYDVGFDISLADARRLAQAEESTGLAGQRSAPPYLQYRPMPLAVHSGTVEARIGDSAFRLDASAKIFDFGSLSVALCLHVGEMPWEEFTGTALALSGAKEMEEAARGIASRLFEKIRPAVTRAAFSDLVEDYGLWHVAAFRPAMSGSRALSLFPQDIARMLTLEKGEFSDAALAEILRSPIRYFENDLCIPDWNAAFVYDPRYHDTVEVLEFLNVQMLELRFFDRVLHSALDDMGDELRKRRGILSVLHDPYETSLRKLSEIKMDISLLRERIGNSLKLAGDVYLAKVYEEARRKAGTETWEATIRDQLKALEDIYTILNNRAAASRAETLEVIIILLIALEIVMGLFRR